MSLVAPNNSFKLSPIADRLNSGARLHMQLSKFEIVSYLSAVVLFFLAQVFFEAPFWLLYVTVGCAGVIVFFVEYKRKSKKFLLLAPESTKYLSPYEINFDDSEVIVSVDGKRYRSVSCDDLIFIGIRVENQGYISIKEWMNLKIDFQDFTVRKHTSVLGGQW